MGLHSTGKTTKEQLAAPFIEQGRTYFQSDSLDQAESQVALALAKNPGDAGALQLQEEIKARRQTLADERAAADKRAADAKAAADKAITDKAAADKLAAERLAEREANQAAAEKLVLEGERFYPSDLAAAESKAEEALRKVPDYKSAIDLQTRVKTRQRKESELAAMIKDARTALNRNDPDAAELAIGNVPTEFAARSEVLALKEDIDDKRKAIAKAHPPPQPVVQSTPRPKGPVDDDNKSKRTAARKAATPKPPRIAARDEDNQRPPPSAVKVPPVERIPPERTQQPPGRPSTPVPKTKGGKGTNFLTY
jgi:hypothetical protein